MDLQMQYAVAPDGARIAYAVAGRGPHLVRTPALPFSHVQLDWKNSEFYARLASMATVVVFDSRGTGMSDRDVADVSLDARITDLEAVVDRLGLTTFALSGVNFSGPTAIAYTAKHPDRVSHLILDDAFARTRDYMRTPHNRAFRELLSDWEGYTEGLAWLLHNRTEEEAKPFAEFLRACVSRDMALRFYQTLLHEDVTGLLPEIRVPTLVLQHTGLKNLQADAGRELAARIPGALLRVLEGSSDDTGQVLVALADFLGIVPGQAGPETPKARPPGTFRTVLFTDIVGHTDMMQRLGDVLGRDVLREHERITRAVLKQHGGAEVKTMGDGFLASFSTVTAALDCAIALQRAFAAHSASSTEALRVRVGLNAGEPIEEDGDLFGSTVILAARIAAQAGAGEILIPEPVHHLLSGKSFAFADRGETALKGFTDPVRLYEVRWQE